MAGVKFCVHWAWLHMPVVLDIHFSGSLTLDLRSTIEIPFIQFSCHTLYQSPSFLSQIPFIQFLPVQASTVVIITSNTLEINHPYNVFPSLNKNIIVVLNAIISINSSVSKKAWDIPFFNWKSGILSEICHFSSEKSGIFPEICHFSQEKSGIFPELCLVLHWKSCILLEIDSDLDYPR